MSFADAILTVMVKRRVLFYDDVAVFGGHEGMTLNALRAMVASRVYDVGFIYSPENVNLAARLNELAAELPSLTLHLSSYTSRSLQFLRTPFAFDAIRELSTFFEGFKPDCVVIVQGEISLSSLGVRAAKRAKIPAVSYIPLAQSRREREGGTLSWLKDLLLGPYYRLPDAYITISNSLASMLRLRGVTQPILVVENGIDPQKLKTLEKSDARRQLGLSMDHYVAAIVGRVETKQKGHDILLRAIADHRDNFRHWKFLIVGDGPDKAALMAVTQIETGPVIEFLRWQRDLAVVYAAVDVVVLPSRFEGVPVVMLEAMYCRVPIVASDLQVMRELLPPHWLFPVDDSDALAERLLQAQHADETVAIDNNRQQVMERFTFALQGEKFCAAVKAFMDTFVMPGSPTVAPKH